MTEPRGGAPVVVEEPGALARACAALDAGVGPIAIDTERASGYRYWQKAYLVQLRREGAGTYLIDPTALDDALDPLSTLLSSSDWVLHAASQDLPCLAELSLAPPALFDTELAARLAGYQRVGLGTLVEKVLGYSLEKGHSAVDWSTRPLPHAWLNYAALDVELLLPLREALISELDGAGKLEWARQEFDAVRLAGPPEPRNEPWRRTSGIHKVRTERGLAIVRALWQARDQLARKRDRAPGRVLQDSAIIAAARDAPSDIHELHALPGFGGQRQRKHAGMWLRHIARASSLPPAELPALSPPHNGPPPPNRWAERQPDAAARLSAARTGLSELAEQHSVPVENVLLPELVRKICWSPPETADSTGVATELRANGAREWQIELTAGLLSNALHAEAH